MNKDNDLGFRILELLSKNLGKQYSIRQISKELNAHYSLTYTKIQELASDKILKLISIGKTKTPKIIFNYNNNKKLAGIELKKLNSLDENTKEILELIESELIREFTNSISLINYEKNKNMNYYEIILLLNQETPAFFGSEIKPIEEIEKQAREKNKEKIKEEIEKSHEKIKEIEKKQGTKINLLILTQEEFNNELFLNQENLTRECFLDKIIFSRPYEFWRRLLIPLKNNEPPEIQKSKKPTEEEILFALNKFGYELFSDKKFQETNISIEKLILELLQSNNARYILAIPILLAKHKTNYRELLFLARRTSKINQLGYFLEITANLKEKKEELMEAIKLFELFKETQSQELINGIHHKPKNNIAKKWLIQTNDSLEYYKEKMSLYGAN
ncbi:MAG: hypothetical protein ABIA76_01820 [Candidatus Diapherotrites archaeon]